MFRFVTFLTVCTVFFATYSLAATVDHVRFGVHADKTRVVFESPRSVKPIRKFILHNPPRYVVDLPETKFTSGRTAFSAPHNAFVKGVRQGLFKPGVTRVVVDLKRPVKAKFFALGKNRKSGHRLVVDLSAASQADISAQKKAIAKMRAEKAKEDVEVTVIEAPQKKSGDIVIVIDPGHGGVDPGAVGKYKTYEKNITLAVGKALHRKINAIPGYKAYLTRHKDIFIPLRDRVRYAQRKHADLFISLHADAHENRKVRGGSVYVLSDKSSDKEAARLARDANRGDLMAGMSLKEEPNYVRQILIDLTQRDTMNKSALLAKEILEDMDTAVYVRKKEVAFAGFRVLKAPGIPSVLVEMSYISNPKEERMLRKASNQNKIAESIARGVQGYMREHHMQ